jgi:hypothetical protein
MRVEVSDLFGAPELDLLAGPERCITLHECGGAVSRFLKRHGNVRIAIWKAPGG